MWCASGCTVKIQGRADRQPKVQVVLSFRLSSNLQSLLVSWSAMTSESPVSTEDNELSMRKHSVVELADGREPLSQSEFDQLHGGHKRTTRSMKERVKRAIRSKCNKASVKRHLNALFPFVSIMRAYDMPSAFLQDILAGLTVCVMQIPQGMAYGLLAGLPPVYGLYTSMIPALAYFFFGTSKHISVGTVAVVSLQVNSATLAFLQSYTPPVDVQQSIGAENETNLEVHYALGNSRYSTEDFREEVAFALTLLVGIVQVVLGAARFGFLTVFLSDSMIDGFTTGLAFHIATSQVFNLVGFKSSQSYSGLLKLVYTYIDLLSNVAKFNLSTVLLSILCMLILVIIKEKIQPAVATRCRLPIPADLLVIICGVLLGYLVDLSSWHVTVVGSIPAGLPRPHIPKVNLLPSLLVSATTIAMVGFVQSISMTKMFALKHGYRVDGNQELIALGASNMLGSFFSCCACSGSVSRSIVQEAAGCQSQVAALVSSLGLLVTLLFVAPVFQTLPHFVLSCIIIVALKSVILRFTEVPNLYRYSKYDFAIWLFSFSSVLLSEPDLGLMAGILFSIATVIVRTQAPYSCVLGQVNGTTLYTDVKTYDDTSEINGVKIFRYDGPLYYASAEHFRKALYHKTGFGRMCKATKAEAEAETEMEMQTIDRTSSTENEFDDNDNEDDQVMRENGAESKCDCDADNALKSIVIDCGSINFVDATGIRMLQQIMQECSKARVTVLIAALRDAVRDSLEKMKFFGEQSRDLVFVTTHDAVLAALRHNETEESKR